MRPSNLEETRIFYVGHHGGHRREYENLLAPMFNLTPQNGKIGPHNIFKFLRARSIFFGTIEDDYVGFIVVACLRSLLGRRTVGLFLRPQTCFKTDGTLRRTWKGWVFSALKQLRGISVGTIIPFAIAPHYARVTRFGVMDPHMWDKGEPSRLAQDISLAKAIAHQAKGRKVLAFVGTVTPIKGIEFLMALLNRVNWPEDKLFVVIAGGVVADLAEPLKYIQPSRALVINRIISDLELEALYLCSELIWACYRPDYDQASGIFGRALQFGNTAIVRRGAQIDQMAKKLGLAVISLDFNEIDSAIEILGRDKCDASAVARVNSEQWRADFVQTIEPLL